jgi:tryptophan-rich sensory protein
VTRPWPLPALLAGFAALGVAFLGGTMTQLGPWYEGLAQPAWAPPRPAFGIAWTLIFACAAVAAVSAWTSTPDRRARELLLGLFALNGFLNVMWSLIFFRLQRPDWAMAELVLLWLSIAALIVVSSRHSRLAAWLLLPYLAWVSVAGLLNWEVVRLNGPFG